MASCALDVPIAEIAEPSVDEKLAALSPDLTVGLFHEVIAAAYDPHVVGLSNFAAPNAKGTELQLRTVDYLRSRLAEMGWESSNTEQVPCIYNMTYQIRLACSTDGGPSVGREGFLKPSLRRKGKGTVRLAGCAASITPCLPGFECPENDVQKIDGCAFYYLLLDLNETSGEIFMELSRPILMIKAWPWTGLSVLSCLQSACRASPMLHPRSCRPLKSLSSARERNNYAPINSIFAEHRARCRA